MPLGLNDRILAKLQFSNGISMLIAFLKENMKKIDWKLNLYATSLPYTSFIVGNSLNINSAIKTVLGAEANAYLSSPTFDYGPTF